MVFHINIQYHVENLWANKLQDEVERVQKIHALNEQFEEGEFSCDAE